MDMGAKQIQDSAVKGKSNQTSGIRLPDYLVIKKAIHIENSTDIQGGTELVLDFSKEGNTDTSYTFPNILAFLSLLITTFLMQISDPTFPGTQGLDGKKKKNLKSSERVPHNC